MLLARRVVLGLVTAIAVMSVAFGDDETAIRDLRKKILREVNRVSLLRDSGDTAASYQLAIEYLDQLGAIEGRESAEVLFDLGMRIQVPSVYKEISSWLASRLDDGTVEFFRRESGRKEPGGKLSDRKIYLTDIMAVSDVSLAAPIVGSMLGSDDFRVLRAAIESLLRIWDRGSIPPLLAFIERLEAENNRGLLIYQDARNALTKITGENFEEVEDWKSWWAPRKDTFDPSTVDQESGTTHRRPREHAPEFAGRKIFSRNTLFIIDTSGSMKYVIKDDIPGLNKADGADRGKTTKKADREPTFEERRLARFWKRIEVAKRELIKAIGKFPRNSRANVMEFNKHCRFLLERLTSLTNKTKLTLSRSVGAMQPSGKLGTDTLLAFEEALKSDPDRRIQNIYFLSDGLPSADGVKNDDPTPLLDKIEALNRFRRIHIHTFGFDPASESNPNRPNRDLMAANQFLQELAKRTGGTFTLLKVTNEIPPPNFQ